MIEEYVVHPGGFEPPTYGFVVRRSIRAELRVHVMGLLAPGSVGCLEKSDQDAPGLSHGEAFC
jgi:hypothetical protein